MSSCSCGEEIGRIDAIVTIDAKGQIVLPKDLREKSKLKPNDKIAVIAYEKDAEVCCIVMIKAEKLSTAVNQTLDPLLKTAAKQEI